MAFSVSSERHWQSGVNDIAKVPKRCQWDLNPSKVVSCEIIMYVQNVDTVFCKGHTTTQVLQLLLCHLHTYSNLYCGIIVINMSDVL